MGELFKVYWSHMVFMGAMLLLLFLCSCSDQQDKTVGGPPSTALPEETGKVITRVGQVELFDKELQHYLAARPLGGEYSR